MSDVVKQAPRFNSRQAAKFAKTLYGLEGKLAALPSERDQNFMLSAPDGRGYVLKIANATESFEVLDLQNRAMAHIARKWRRAGNERPVCPEVQLSLDREAISRIHGADGVQHFIRLVSYLPGKPLALVRPHSDDLLADLGRFFGSVDRSLADFDHPAAGRDFHWDLQRAGAVVGEHIAPRPGSPVS
jgi:Ser/Thr protein kinase RdoA (MazF antagonist)